MFSKWKKRIKNISIDRLQDVTYRNTLKFNDTIKAIILKEFGVYKLTFKTSLVCIYYQCII